MIVPIGDQLDRGGHGAQEATTGFPVDAIAAGYEAGGKFCDPPIGTGSSRAHDLTDLIGDGDPNSDKCQTSIGVKHMGGERDHERGLMPAMVLTQITLGDARPYDRSIRDGDLGKGGIARGGPVGGSQGEPVAEKLTIVLAFRTGGDKRVWAYKFLAALWEGAIVAFNLSSFVAKGPVAVFDYLVTVPSAAANRSDLLSALWITLRDAAFGYVGGTVIAVAVAVAVVWRKDVAQTVMPVAIALRSVPLVAMVPILTLVLGQGLLSVVVIAGIVTFFPTLVNVVEGLRSAPATAFDLFAAYGATDFEILRKARLPYALPAIFASARIAAPGALLGAILAEWLSTGQGLGDLMVTSSSTANYSMLWSAVVTITAVSILIYNAVSAIERPVVARLGITSP